MSGAGAGINIHSDLEVRVGRRHARLLADGSHLRLVTNDPVGLWSESARAVRAATDRSTPVRAVIARTAAALDDAGLSVEVTGTGGTLIELGRDRGSRIGRLATGSPHVRLGDPLAVASALLTGAGRARIIVAAVPVALIVAAVRLRRRRPGPP